MRTIIDFIITVVFFLFAGTAALKVADQFVEEVAIKKISKGLPSLESFTQKLTRPDM